MTPRSFVYAAAIVLGHLSVDSSVAYAQKCQDPLKNDLLSQFQSFYSVGRQTAGGGTHTYKVVSVPNTEERTKLIQLSEKSKKDLETLLEEFQYFQTLLTQYEPRMNYPLE